ncbi:DUF2510 domain-containing protein [Nocardioides lijunqiniae]|uniref:DUF2510 domain-containing protein n=1 Tax=Nocardioides lijunqiniae TaxID=2760832 RepID=UPI001D0CA691|nr:DUF2510 domain-containing protein [Nocardioides lijunqiniae]
MTDEQPTGRSERSKKAMDAALSKEQRAPAKKPADQPARQKPPAGWYPHPTMADTRRYWDGDKWTENIAPNAAPSRNTPGAIKKISWAIALVFLAPLLVLTFMGTSVDGESCGNWISAEFTDTKIAIRQAEVIMDEGGAIEAARISAVAKECNDAISTQRLIAFVLIGLGVGSRIAIPVIAGALRD